MTSLTMTITHCEEMLPWSIVDVGIHNAYILVFLGNIRYKTLFAPKREVKAKGRRTVFWLRCLFRAPRASDC
jgi:hypothetical protein